MLWNRMVSSLCAGLVVMVAAAGVARGDDQVDNPRYKAWASFKPESSETIAGTMSMGPMQIPMEMKLTLKEVTDDHVTVEITQKMTINGQDRQSPANTQTVNAKTDAKDVKELDPEDVDAMGKTFKCKVMEVKNDLSKQNPAAAGATATMKVWASSDVPGGIVKLEMTMQRPGQATAVTITYLLKAYEKK